MESKQNKNTKIPIFLIICVFVFLLLIRLIHIDADPPHNLSTSMGYLSDPGNYVFNARNKILFGKWKVDDWNLMYVSPFPHYLTYLVFFIFGPGIAQMNIIPILFSIGNIILFFLIIYHPKSPFYFPLLFTLLLGVNFHFLMFSRIAVRVMPMLFFILLALFCLIKLKKRIKYILVGACCFIAFSIKGTALTIIPSFIGAVFLYEITHESLKSFLKNFIIFLSGVAPLAVLWFLAIYLPNNDIIRAYGSENINWLTPKNFLVGLINFWRRPLFFSLEMPLITILGSLFLFLIIIKYIHSSHSIQLIDWVLFFWISSNILYFSFIYYRPTRHFIPLIVPLVLAGVRLFNFLFQSTNSSIVIKPIKFNYFFSFLALVVWNFFLTSFIFILFIKRPSLGDELRIYSLKSLIISIIVSLLIFLMAKQILQIKIKKEFTFILLVSIFIISFSFHFTRYLKWSLKPNFHIKNISQDLDKALPNSILAGLITPMISLENKLKVHPYYSGYINKGPDFLKKYNITHILTTTYAVEKKNYIKDFPQELEKSRLIARFPLWKTHVELIKLNPNQFGQTDNDHEIIEAELLFGSQEIPRYDPCASNKFAIKSRNNYSSNFHTSPLKLQPGVYKLSLRVKGTKLPSENNPVMMITINEANKKQKYLLKKIIDAKDIKNNFRYKILSFLFKKPHEEDDENLVIKIHFYKKGEVWLDYLMLNLVN